MEILNKMTTVQIFINEYAFPGCNVLIIGDYLCEIKEICSFCNTFFINDIYIIGIDIISDKYIPFDNNTFDLIIILKDLFNQTELDRVNKNALRFCKI